MAGTTLLLVDDESSLRSMISRALTDEGYRVLEAGDGVEALEILSRPGHEVRLIITDIRMPRMDGYELADRLVMRPRPLPMIFISGYGQAGISLPGSIFPKPFSMEDLLGEIRRLLGEETPQLQSG
ncbi:MAG TPA: response regulator [Gemmatimonadales bacterium]|jgi:CheY-like chemotaxis protein